MTDTEVVAAIREELAHVQYACVRDPLLDRDCPDTSDVDVLVFDDVDDLVPERRRLGPASGSRLVLDLLRVPARSIDDPAAFATAGLLVHRLLGSRPIVVREPFGAAVERVRTLAARTDVHTRRLGGFLDMGVHTVREVGITWDFPELALLWSAIAQIACAAAMIDATGELCPNIYTRPLEHLRAFERRFGPELVRPFVAAARLNADPAAAVAPLERIQAVVARRFPEPAWPPNMRAGTRAEYRYFSARDELALRVATARELQARGDAPAGLFYLRFHAYMLARVPMVAGCARDGRNVTFIRPERAVRRVLEAECPEIVDDLRAVLGGGERLGVADVVASLEATARLRRVCLEFLLEHGHDLRSQPAWEPCRPPPPEPPFS